MLLSVLHKSNPLSSGAIVFAGSTSGTSGTTDGNGTAARFNSPSRIVSDSSGNFYVSDTSNHAIRKITRTGVVTSYFGTPGTAGSTTSTLNSPRGLAFDASNNLYIADFSNSRVICVPNGSSTGTVVATNIYNVEEIATNSNGSEMVFQTTATSRANLIQYRNGVVEGTISRTYNTASITCRTDGVFYYSSTVGQENNQIGFYKMLLTQPVTYNFQIYALAQQAGTVDGIPYPATIETVGNPANSGVVQGSTFTISGYGAGSKLNGFVASVTAVNPITYQSLSQGRGLIEFNFVGWLNDYPVGVPTGRPTIAGGTSNFDIIGVGWDSGIVPWQGGSNLPSAPNQALRMNFYLKNTKYNPALPDIPHTGLTGPGPLALSEIKLSVFEGNFTIYNGTFSGYIYDYPPYNYTVSSTNNYTTSHTITNVSLSSNASDLSNAYITGPTIEYGTFITAYTPSTGAFTTNKPFRSLGNSEFTIDLIAGVEPNVTHSFTGVDVNNLYVGMIIRGGGIKEGVDIIEISPTSKISGTITTRFPFTVDSLAPSHTLSASYEISKWIGGATRLVVVTFNSTLFPSGAGGGSAVNPICSVTTINNNPTSVEINGGLYGTYIKNLQFSKTDNTTLYASPQSGGGITRYSLSGNSITTVETLGEVPNVDSFALLPVVSQIIPAVPQPSSNNIQIYEEIY